jgi:hypothetical protein
VAAGMLSLFVSGVIFGWSMHALACDGGGRCS